MKLNGWQRLWVLTSIIIFVIAVYYTIAQILPEKSRIMSRWACETIEAVRNIKEYSDEHTSEIDLFKISLEVALSELRNYAPRGYGYKELIDKIHEKYVEKNPLIRIKFDEIDKRYRNELDTLPIERAKVALIVFAI